MIRLAITITMAGQNIAGSTVPSTTTGSSIPLSTADSTIPLSTAGSAVPSTTADSTIPLSTADSAVPLSNTGSAVPLSTTDSAVPLSNTGSDFPMFNPRFLFEEPFNLGSPMPMLIHTSHRQKLPEAASHRQRLHEARLPEARLHEARLPMPKSSAIHPSCLATDGCHLFDAQLSDTRVSGIIGAIDKKLVPIVDNVWRLKQQLLESKKKFEKYEGCLSELLRNEQIFEAKLQRQEEKLQQQEELIKELIKQLQEKSQ